MIDSELMDTAINPVTGEGSAELNQQYGATGISHYNYMDTIGTT
jgi:hypothetical protein